MLKAKIDRNNNVICPNCDKSEYEIFRRNNLGEEVYLNHCKCSCGQLFTHAPESHGCEPVDEWLSVRGSAPRNPLAREATAVKPWSFTYKVDKQNIAVVE